MTEILFLVLFLNFPFGQKEQGEKVKADVTLMYRRSGGTAQSFQNVENRDTVHYFKRGMNPYYRVYNIRLDKENIMVDKITLKGYSGDSLKVEEEQKPRILNGRVQFVDQHVDPDEDFLEIMIHYTNEEKRAMTYTLLVVLEDEQY